MPDRVAIILLAAGGSSRRGEPKQLMAFEGRSFLRAAAEAAVGAGAAKVIVVLGNRAKTCEAELTGLDVFAVVNEDWERGMGSSLRTGAQAAARSDPTVTAALVHLCDQPLVDAAALRSLIAARDRTGKPVIVSEYGGSIGPPVLFAGGYFEQLRTWPHDDAGAKALINAAPAADVLRVPLQAATLDLDTPDDYRQMRRPPTP